MSPTRRANDPPDARSELYQAMRDAMEAELRAYYLERPDIMLDARSEAAIRHSLEGLRKFYALIDKYEITWKDGSEK
jgi:hypothetical protein